MELFDKSINIISSQAISMKREIYELFKKKNSWIVLIILLNLN